MTVCLLASVYSTLGMKTVYYRNGQVCDECADEHNRNAYYPSGGNRQVVYRTEERIISSRPSSLSSSYVVNRDDSGYYSSRNIDWDIIFFLVYFNHKFRVENHRYKFIMNIGLNTILGS